MGGASSLSLIPRMQLPAVVNAASGAFSTNALLDSGAEQNFIDGGLTWRLGIKTIPLRVPVSVVALTGQLLPSVTHETEPVPLILSGNHREVLRFFCFLLPGVSHRFRISVV